MWDYGIFEIILRAFVYNKVRQFFWVKNWSSLCCFPAMSVRGSAAVFPGISQHVFFF